MGVNDVGTPLVPGRSATGSENLQPLDARALGGIGRRVARLDGADLHELPRLRLPDADGPLVLRARHDRAFGLGDEACVRLWAGLSPARRRRLAEVADWPIRMVHDDGRPAGVIVTRPPAAHRQRMRLPSGGIRTVGRTLDLLMIDAPVAEWLELPVPDVATRLGICRSLTENLRLLHELRTTVPGMTARDISVTCGAEPEVRFQSLELTVGADDTSDDLHRLGLLILRCLTPGRFRSTARDPGAASAELDAAGLALLHRAIDGPPTARPTADEWAHVLAAQPGQRPMPPVLDVAEVDRTIVAAGDGIVVHWMGTGVDTITVEGPSCPPVRVTVTGGSGAVSVVPHRSGPLVVRASNPVGAAEHDLGRIAVHDVARMGDLPVPIPRLDWPVLDGPDLPDLRPVMPPPPDLTGAHLPDRSALTDLLTAAPDVAGPHLFPQVAPPPDLIAGTSALPVDLVDLLAVAPAFPRNTRRRLRLFRRRVAK